MAIEEVRKKIVFQAFDVRKGKAVDTSPTPTITLQRGSLRFNSYVIAELQLDGKFVKFYIDPLKLVIGFKIRETINQTEMKDWKLVRQNKSSGAWTVGIQKILMAMKPEAIDKLYVPLPIKKYVESSDAMMRGETYYFIDISTLEEKKKTV